MKPSAKVIARKEGVGRKSASKAAPAISRMSVSDGKSERSVSIRKIDNGFIVSESTYGPKCGYKTKETFTPTAPKIEMGTPKAKK